GTVCLGAPPALRGQLPDCRRILLYVGALGVVRDRNPALRALPLGGSHDRGENAPGVLRRGICRIRAAGPSRRAAAPAGLQRTRRVRLEPAALQPRAPPRGGRRGHDGRLRTDHALPTLTGPAGFATDRETL